VDVSIYCSMASKSIIRPLVLPVRNEKFIPVYATYKPSFRRRPESRCFKKMIKQLDPVFQRGDDVSVFMFRILVCHLYVPQHFLLLMLNLEGPSIFTCL
jgi:hypothetical protein